MTTPAVTNMISFISNETNMYYQNYYINSTQAKLEPMQSN